MARLCRNVNIETILFINEIHGYNDTDLAKKIGVSRAYFSRIKNKSKELTLENKKIISDFFNIPQFYFFINVMGRYLDKNNIFSFFYGNRPIIHQVSLLEKELRLINNICTSFSNTEGSGQIDDKIIEEIFLVDDAVKYLESKGIIVYGMPKIISPSIPFVTYYDKKYPILLLNNNLSSKKMQSYLLIALTSLIHPFINFNDAECGNNYCELCYKNMLVNKYPIGSKKIAIQSIYGQTIHTIVKSKISQEIERKMYEFCLDKLR